MTALSIIVVFWSNRLSLLLAYVPEEYHSPQTNYKASNDTKHVFVAAI